MEVPTIFLIDALGLRREQVGVECRRDIHIKPVEVVEIVLGVHHPLRITKHPDVQRGVVGCEVIELSKHYVELG